MNYKSTYSIFWMRLNWLDCEEIYYYNKTEISSKSTSLTNVRKYYKLSINYEFKMAEIFNMISFNSEMKKSRLFFSKQKTEIIWDNFFTVPSSTKLLESTLQIVFIEFKSSLNLFNSSIDCYYLSSSYSKSFSIFVC